MKIKKLNEICDDLPYDDFKFSVAYQDGYPFVYDDNRILIGNKSDTHTEVNTENDIDFLMNEGRFWLKEEIRYEYNILSFWNYPSKENWIKFLKLFQEETGNNPFDGTWLVEVKYDDSIEGEIKMIDKLEEYCLIPVEEYIGSENPSEEKKMWHLMKVNDIRRKEREKSEYFGSKADKRPLKWKQSLLKSENINVKDFKTFIGK